MTKPKLKTESKPTPRKLSNVRIPVEKVVGFYANPPARTDKEAAHFKDLVEYLRSGGGIEPISVVLDAPNGVYRLSSGHRRTAAHRECGITTILANVTVPREDESAIEVQREMFKNHSKNKPIVGKDHLYIALATKGEVLLNNTAKKNWGLIQAHFDVKDKTDLEYLKLHATTDLLKIAQTLANLANNTDTGEGSPMSAEEYSFFFRQSVRYLVRERNQRDVRDVIANKTVLSKTLRKAIIPDGGKQGNLL